VACFERELLIYSCFFTSGQYYRCQRGRWTHGRGAPSPGTDGPLRIHCDHRFNRKRLLFFFPFQVVRFFSPLLFFYPGGDAHSVYTILDRHHTTNQVPRTVRK
jgi:hypothetical protein